MKGIRTTATIIAGHSRDCPSSTVHQMFHFTFLVLPAASSSKGGRPCADFQVTGLLKTATKWLPSTLFILYNSTLNVKSYFIKIVLKKGTNSYKSRLEEFLIEHF